MLMGYGTLAGLPVIRNYRSRRISSWATDGRNHDCWNIKPGERRDMAVIEGPGCVKHIWVTMGSGEHAFPRKVILRAWWDGEETPSIECPIGDFFGLGHCRHAEVVSIPMVTGSRRGMTCYFPMPFNRSARLEVENPCACPVEAFYFYVDYEAYEEPCNEAACFHAQWRRENPCKAVRFPRRRGRLLADSSNEVNLDGKENYVILDARGRGHYVGCVLSVDNTEAFHQNYTWFGEGDDMIFVDGEVWPPSLHGTGTEDYFCSAWGFPSGAYAGPYHGVSLAGDVEEWSGKWSVYRFHIEDPVVFRKSIHVTIEHGHANDQGNDYSSTAYWYQTEPHKKFPAMPPVEKRLPNKRYR